MFYAQQRILLINDILSSQKAEKTFSIPLLKFLIFILIPIIEISIFITVGSNIGILNTIAIILITALVGIFLVRKRGLSLLFNARQNMSEGVMPTNEIKGGIFLLISGLLLITPGFFTDCIGFAMFLKPVQNFISKRAKNYFQSRVR